MRYYDIQITDPDSGALIRRYTSIVNGRTDPGALNVEIDAPVMGFAEPLSVGSVGTMIRVWGISERDRSQATDLAGKLISVRGGMARGLPLANPSQAGLLVQGRIFQAFGNWLGTSVTLDMIVLADTGTSAAPKNISLDWRAGTRLSDALAVTLRTAFPGRRITMAISDKLVRGTDEPGFYATLGQLAKYVKRTTQDIVGGDYRGVTIALRDNEFLVYDGTSRAAPKQISLNDLIGQPTWIDFPAIQVTCPMRGDLFLSDFIRLPVTPTTTTASSLAPFRGRSVFQGVFQIYQLRHVGNFRQPDGESWVTAFDAFPVPEAA